MCRILHPRVGHRRAPLQPCPSVRAFPGPSSHQHNLQHGIPNQRKCSDLRCSVPPASAVIILAKGATLTVSGHTFILPCRGAPSSRWRDESSMILAMDIGLVEQVEQHHPWRLRACMRPTHRRAAVRSHAGTPKRSPRRGSCPWSPLLQS